MVWNGILATWVLLLLQDKSGTGIKHCLLEASETTCVPLESASPMHAACLPLPVVLVVVPPAVPSRTLALASLPEALIHIPVGIHLLPQPLLQVIRPAALHQPRLAILLS